MSYGLSLRVFSGSRFSGLQVISSSLLMLGLPHSFAFFVMGCVEGMGVCEYIQYSDLDMYYVANGFLGV